MTIESGYGPSRIQLATGAVLEGEVDASPGELVLELAGEGEVDCAAELTATVYAPRGAVRLSLPGGVQRGAFFAKNIYVAEDTTILHQDPAVVLSW